MGSDAADAGADTDTGSSLAACDLDKPFGEATLVQGAINSTRNDDGFWLLDGGLTAYLSSDRLDAGPDGANDYRIFTATRPDPTAAWGSITPEPNVDDAGSGRAPVLTANGLTLYFFRGAGGPTKVWTATRASLTDPFSAPTQAGAPLNVNTATTDTVTWVSPDGAAVAFSSNRNGGDIDIYRVEQGSTGFGAPVALTELSSSAEDYAIFTADELQAFVSSKRATTKGGLDIYYARRAKKTDTFPHPAPLDILNTSVSENAAYASADGCTLYFKRATAPFGEYKIFVAARPK